MEQTRATTEPKSLPTSRKEATISVSRVMIPPPHPRSRWGEGGGEEEALLASITIYRPGIYQLLAASALTWPEGAVVYRSGSGHQDACMLKGGSSTALWIRGNTYTSKQATDV